MAGAGGALKTIPQQPFGKALLIAVAIGLAGYALWRLSAPPSVMAPNSATAPPTGSRRSPAASPTRSSASRRWRSAAAPTAALALIGVAVYQAYKGLAKKFLEDAKTNEMRRPAAALRLRDGGDDLGRDQRAVRGRAAPLEIAFGSCRVALPHEPPFTDGADHENGFEPDALWVLAKQMAESERIRRPDQLFLLGDQVYVDEGSPKTRAKIRERRGTGTPPSEEILDFEEYTWLYRESWSEPLIRWLLS